MAEHHGSGTSYATEGREDELVSLLRDRRLSGLYVSVAEGLTRRPYDHFVTV
jgi:hypothetical protein